MLRFRDAPRLLGAMTLCARACAGQSTNQTSPHELLFLTIDFLDEILLIRTLTAISILTIVSILISTAGLALETATIASVETLGETGTGMVVEAVGLTIDGRKPRC